MAAVRIGVSGWSYPSWRGDFYPVGLVQRRELEYAAQWFGSVELNGSFYSLQRPSSFRTWHDQTPDDFEFAVKGGRFLTHMKRLREVETPLANFFASGVLALGHKLGPVLWQLPANFGYDEERLVGFFDLLPRTTGQAARIAEQHDSKVPHDRALTRAEVDRPIRYALEVRNTGFDSPDAFDLLAEHDIALVVSDGAGRWPQLEHPTTDLMYVRLHGHTELYASRYSGRSLDAWAKKVRSWAAGGRDVYVYFDNDARGHAPHDAVALSRRVGIAVASSDHG